MLGLTLREEFRGKRLKGTAIELSNDNKTGATQVAASEFLEITYPTSDLLKALEAIEPGQGRPLVILGERGLGKSHVMAAPQRHGSDHRELASPALQISLGSPFRQTPAWQFHSREVGGHGRRKAGCPLRRIDVGDVQKTADRTSLG